MVYTAALLLVGIVVNNGIVLVDYANQLRQAGMDRAEALLTAARHRFRPIIMTALTTICGMIPLTFGSSERWRSDKLTPFCSGKLGNRTREALDSSFQGAGVFQVAAKSGD